MRRDYFNGFDAYSKWEAEKEEEEYQRFLEAQEENNKSEQNNDGVVKNPEQVTPSTTTQLYEKDGQLSFFPVIEKQKKRSNKVVKNEDEEREL